MEYIVLVAPKEHCRQLDAVEYRVTEFKESAILEGFMQFVREGNVWHVKKERILSVQELNGNAS